MAGRRPLPAAIHKLNGNPSKITQSVLDSQMDPKTSIGRPEKPKGMSKLAKREWDRIVTLLESNGLVTRVDGKALMAYCECYALYEQAREEMRKNGITFVTHYLNNDGETVTGDIKANPAVAISFTALKTMKAFLIEFGLTPASRRNLKVAKPEEADPATLGLARKPSAMLLMKPIKPEEMLADDEPAK